MKALEDIARKMGGGTVSVGFMEDATYSDGTSVASVAFWQEFGTKGIPARPFFREMISKESPSWPATMARLAKMFDYDAQKVLGMMGEDISGALAQSINELSEPALSPVTLMLREIYGNDHSEIRGRDVGAAAELVKEGYTGATGTQAKPLIWTGHMLQSITSKVDK